MRCVFALTLVSLQVGCTALLGVEETHEARPATISVAAEGVTEPATLQLTGPGVMETLVIRSDGTSAFATGVSPSYEVTVLGGAPCALGPNAAGSANGDAVTVQLACIGATQLVGLEVETILGTQPVLAAGVTSYAVTVGELQQRTRITAMPRQSNATLTIQGMPAQPGVATAPIALGEGETAVTIVVDHPLSATLRTTYTVAVKRTTPPAYAAFDVPVARTDDLVGWSVGTDGVRYITGAPNEDSATDPMNLADAGEPNSGAAFIYARQGKAWGFEAALKAPNADSRGIGDRFGWAVAIDGDRAVVGAPFEDSATTNPNDNSLQDAGAAYVYRRQGTAWVFETYLKSPHPTANGYFGYSVAISGDTIVVGAYFDDQYAGNSLQIATAGQAHVYRRSGTAWSLEQSLGVDETTGAYDGLGFSVAIDGDRIVAGAYAGHRTVGGAGAARIFARSGTTWTLEAQIEPGVPMVHDYFGASVAIEGDTVVVGASALETSNTDLPGAAYVFTRAGGVWQQQAQLLASNGEADDQFGRGVAIAGDRIAVSAWTEDEVGAGIAAPPGSNANGAQDAGAVYLFKRAGGQWAENKYIKGPDGEAFDEFGAGIAMAPSGVLVIGSPGDDSDGSDVTNNSTSGAGACYVLH